MKKLFLTAAGALLALSSFGWSQKGHDTVAFIAENHFTPATADSVAAILEGKSPVYWANWLDNASHTPDYAYTSTWHYKNIDEGVDYDKAPALPEGDAVRAIREQIAILSDSVSTMSQKQLAMKILIHVVGDLHQPMHLGRSTDKGANHVKVDFFGRKTNLHSVWDGQIMNSGHAWTYTEWQQQLDRLSREQEAAESAGNVDDWARQTWQITKDVYKANPEGCKLSYNEVARWTPVIEQQVLRGGLRLARILNAIYDPDSPDNPANF